MSITTAVGDEIGRLEHTVHHQATSKSDSSEAPWSRCAMSFSQDSHEKTLRRAAKSQEPMTFSKILQILSKGRRSSSICFAFVDLDASHANSRIFKPGTPNGFSELPIQPPHVRLRNDIDLPFIVNRPPNQSDLSTKRISYFASVSDQSQTPLFGSILHRAE